MSGLVTDKFAVNETDETSATDQFELWANGPVNTKLIKDHYFNVFDKKPAFIPPKVEIVHTVDIEHVHKYFEAVAEAHQAPYSKLRAESKKKRKKTISWLPDSPIESKGNKRIHGLDDQANEEFVDEWHKLREAERKQETPVSFSDRNHMMQQLNELFESGKYDDAFDKSGRFKKPK